MAAVLAIGGASVTALKILNAVIFGLNIFVVGITLIRITGGTIWPAVLGSTVTMICFDMLFQHSWLLTDALFVLLVIISLVCLDRFVRNRLRSYFLAAVVLTGLACLTRYAGLGILLAQAVFLMFFDRANPFFARVVRATILCVGSLLPLALWLLRNFLLESDLTDRPLAVHIISWQHVNMALPVLAKWLLPGFLGLILLYSLRNSFRARSQLDDFSVGSLETLLLLYMVSYSTFLLFTITFVDAHTPLNGRILLSLFPCAVIVFVSLGNKICQPISTRLSCRALIGLIFLGTSVTYGKESLEFVRYAHENGLGYASRQWISSPTMATLHSYREPIRVYSNGTDVVRVLTRHHAFPIPRLVNPTSRRSNPNFEQQLLNMKRTLKSQPSVLVWFRELESRRWYLPSESELIDTLELRVVRKLQDGTVYRLIGDTN